MKKLVRVSTDLQVTIHDYPEGSYQIQNKALRKLIGNDCDLYESVSPKRLYSKVKIGKKMEKEGHRMVMLVDEEGLLKSLESNILGSWLYETDKHGYPIAGNVLFVGTKYTGMGIDFCGISEDAAESLKKEFEEQIAKGKA
jgi:hypothetical protein|nr:MAG TPA: protein of unknown function (DUF3846) [Caudoviricetes sp.]